MQYGWIEKSGTYEKNRGTFVSHMYIMPDDDFSGRTGEGYHYF